MSAFVLDAQRVSGHGGRICGIAGESMSAVRRETGRETGECAGVCSLWSLKSGYGGENEEVGLLQLIQSTSRCLWPLAPSRPPPTHQLLKLHLNLLLVGAGTPDVHPLLSPTPGSTDTLALLICLKGTLRLGAVSGQD